MRHPLPHRDPPDDGAKVPRPCTDALSGNIYSRKSRTVVANKRRH